MTHPYYVNQSGRRITRKTITEYQTVYRSRGGLEVVVTALSPPSKYRTFRVAGKSGERKFKAVQSTKRTKEILIVARKKKNIPEEEIITDDELEELEDLEDLDDILGIEDEDEEEVEDEEVDEDEDEDEVEDDDDLEFEDEDEEDEDSDEDEFEDDDEEVDDEDEDDEEFEDVEEVEDEDDSDEEEPEFEDEDEDEEEVEVTTTKKKRPAKKKAPRKKADKDTVGTADVAAAFDTDARTLRMVLRKHNIPKDPDSNRYEWSSLKHPQVRKIGKLIKEGEANKVKKESLDKVKNRKTAKQSTGTKKTRSKASSKSTSTGTRKKKAAPAKKASGKGTTTRRRKKRTSAE